MGQKKHTHKKKKTLICKSLQKQIQDTNRLICTRQGWQLLQSVAPLVCHLRDAVWRVKNRTLLTQQPLRWKLRRQETVVEPPSWASPSIELETHLMMQPSHYVQTPKMQGIRRTFDGKTTTKFLSLILYSLSAVSSSRILPKKRNEKQFSNFY